MVTLTGVYILNPHKIKFLHSSSDLYRYESSSLNFSISDSRPLIHLVEVTAGSLNSVNTSSSLIYPQLIFSPVYIGHPVVGSMEGAIVSFWKEGRKLIVRFDYLLSIH